jgi:hypothetical protein
MRVDVDSANELFHRVVYIIIERIWHFIIEVIKMNKSKEKVLLGGKSIMRRGFLPLLALFFLTGGVVAPAFADWQVDDDKTQEEIRKMKEKLDERLKKIYEQSYIQTDSSKAFDVNAHKTKTLQSEEGNSDGFSGKLGGRKIDDFVDQRCPSDSNNPSDSEQQPICVDIVKHENKLFNYLLAMLDLNKQRQEELKQIIEDRKSFKDTDYGALESNTNRLLALRSQQAIDAANVSLTIDSYDRYLSGQRASLADITRNLQRGTGAKNKSALNDFLGGILGEDNPLTGIAEDAIGAAGPLLVLKGSLQVAKHYDD